MMITNTCCFTGHRAIPPHMAEHICDEAYKAIKTLIEQGVNTFICGGAVGFDQICGVTVLKLKETYPDISLIMAIPHRDQAKYFGDSEKHIYQHLLENSSENVYVCENYSRSCFHMRNRYMVDNAQHVIAYCVMEKGGTFSTVEYARSKNRNIIFV